MAPADIRKRAANHHIECHGKLIDSGRVHAHAAAGGKANLGADIGKNLAQYVDILDIGQVLQAYRPRRPV
jgi:hypothetical protein